MPLILLFTLIFSSCAALTAKKWPSFDSAHYQTLSSEQDKKTYLDQVLKTHYKEVLPVPLAEIFIPPQGTLARLAIVNFETIIQETFMGLTNQHNLYLTAEGKQVWANQMLETWYRSLKQFPEINLVSWDELKNSKIFKAEFPETLIIKGNELKSELKTSHFEWLGEGRNCTEERLVMPQFMPNISFATVPGTEFLAVPRETQHRKFWLNDIAKETKSDVLLSVFTNVSWLYAKPENKKIQIEKLDKVTIKILAALVVPFSRYLPLVKEKRPYSSLDNLTLTYRIFEIKSEIPLDWKLKPHRSEVIESELNTELLQKVNSNYQTLVAILSEKINKELQKTKVP